MQCNVSWTTATFQAKNTFCKELGKSFYEGKCTRIAVQVSLHELMLPLGWWQTFAILQLSIAHSCNKFSAGQIFASFLTLSTYSFNVLIVWDLHYKKALITGDVEHRELSEKGYENVRRGTQLSSSDSKTAQILQAQIIGCIFWNCNFTHKISVKSCSLSSDSCTMLNSWKTQRNCWW